MCKFIIAPADFSVDGPLSHTFTPDSFEAPYCFNITIEDDLALENLEIFVLNLFSEDSSVDFKVPVLTVEIQDNDSKTCLLEYLNYFP